MALDSTEKPQSRPNQTRSPHSSGDIEHSQPNPFPRLRAKTVHAATMPIDEAESPLISTNHHTAEESADVFERKESASSDEINDDLLDSPIQDLPERFNELPIELISLTDRFVASLTTRIYSTPPSIDRLSDLYQEFYIRAGSRIATHVSTLASRLNREVSPSGQTRTSRNAKKTQSSNNGSEKEGASSEKTVTAQQMLTAAEVAERRKARKLLQYKQHALEEAVERRVCESIYDKIWRHRSTIDEIRDEKLRSKTAALSVMEIGLQDLGVDIPKGNDEDKIFDPKEWLASASQSLTKINEEKFPLGKLQHLTAAHKAIVDALTNVQPSSSSADEILPTLIYTLIISPPEETNSISNLMFIQRFRAADKVDGETAYCLTNLEAAISFLENVDITSLRGDDAGAQLLSTENSNPDRPLASSIENHGAVSPSPSQSGAANVDKDPVAKTETKPASTTGPSTQQRLTNLFQPPAKALGAANDIVRNTADQGFKNISNTLDNSFNMLFGKLKEVQINQGGKASGGLTVVPKTLEDARRLVLKDSSIPDDSSTYSEDGAVKDNHTTVSTSATSRARLDDRLAELVGGRRQATNNNATTKVTPTTVSADGNATTDEPPSKLKSASTMPAPSPQTPNAPFGSVRNIQNTLNPLNHIPSMIRGLGRNASESPQPAGDNKPRLRNKVSGFLNAEPPADKKIDPPIERFVEMKEASELKLGDVPELLADYKRLAMIVDSLQSS